MLLCILIRSRPSFQYIAWKGNFAAGKMETPESEEGSTGHQYQSSVPWFPSQGSLFTVQATHRFFLTAAVLLAGSFWGIFWWKLPKSLDLMNSISHPKYQSRVLGEAGKQIPESRADAQTSRLHIYWDPQILLNSAMNVTTFIMLFFTCKVSKNITLKDRRDNAGDQVLALLK